MARSSCVCACIGPPHGTLPLFGIHVFMLIFFILIAAQYSKANGVVEGAPLLVELQ